MKLETFPEDTIQVNFDAQFEGLEVIYDYDQRLCDLVIQYGREGNKIEGFAGKYNINPDAMSSWLSDAGGKTEPEFTIACKISVCACYHYWNGLYTHTLKQCMAEKDGFEALPHIYNVVKEIEKSMPNTINPFTNLVSLSAEEKKKHNLADNITEVSNLLLGVGEE
jgi:hypothetical protein